MLGAISSIANALNVVILQMPIAQCCGSVAAVQCVYNLLGAAQILLQVFSFLTM